MLNDRQLHSKNTHTTSPITGNAILYRFGCLTTSSFPFLFYWFSAPTASLSFEDIYTLSAIGAGFL
jgi:hypothetical protein